MGWTKRQFIEQAFTEIGLGSYFFDLSPEQLQVALLSLESMMGEWYSNDIMIGYSFAANPQTANIDDETSIPFNNTRAVVTNLAVAIAPHYGKTPSQETKITANNGYTVLCKQAAMPKQVKLPTSMPLGAGNKRQLERYVAEEVDEEINLRKPEGSFH